MKEMTLSEIMMDQALLKSALRKNELRTQEESVGMQAIAKKISKRYGFNDSSDCLEYLNKQLKSLFTFKG